MWVDVFFFFKDPATTEIYTYCHTLSLHDALPISQDGPPHGRTGSTSGRENPDLGDGSRCAVRPKYGGDLTPCRHPRSRPNGTTSASADGAGRAGRGSWRISSRPPIRLRPNQHPHNRTSVVTVRSEEHTSELQSLMRISYAVFCLKKKKTNQ